MFIRNALIHCIGEIKSFLRKELGEKYEEELAGKLSYQRESFGYTVKESKDDALEEHMRQLSLLGERKASDEVPPDIEVSETKTVKNTDGDMPQDIDAPENKAVKKVGSEIPLDAEALEHKTVKKVDDEVLSGTEVSEATTVKKGSHEVLPIASDAHQQKSSSSSISTQRLSSSNSVLYSSSAKKESLPAYTDIRAIDSKKLCNGLSWGQHLQMSLDDFIESYRNSLQKFDLIILKRFILIRFLRALEKIESDPNLTEMAIKKAVEAQVKEATILLDEVRENAAYGLVSSVKVEHTSGKTEFYVNATGFTLDNIAKEMLKIEKEAYKLPCDIFDLTDEIMQNSENVLLLALSNSFKYMAGSFFTESRALSIQCKYSAYNPKAYYDYPSEMTFSQSVAAQKRSHWRTTCNDLKSFLGNAKFTDGQLEFPGGEQAYLEIAENVARRRQGDAALLRRNKLGQQEGLDKSYGEFLLGLTQRYQSRRRFAL